MTAPTVFDELFALLTPDSIFRDPRATGEGVAVAVIDSGVERAVLEDKFRAAGTPIQHIEGAMFRPSGPPLPYTGHQSSPHGTTVADIVLTMAPRVKLYSADVFGPAGSCEVETVIAALRHCIDVWQVKVVNLSLGVPEHKLQQLPRRQQLQRAIEEAYFRDVLVFAAAHNEHPLTRSYPAAFAPPLISVDKGLFDDPLEFAYKLTRARRVPGAREGLPGAARAGAGDELGDPAPGRDRGPHPVAEAGPEAVRDQDDPVLAVPQREQRGAGLQPRRGERR